ncbi:hypothetical protein EYC84_004285 [Monilinia fructicola]|uniref:Uncharacterized protein n=1 Tax=Monilinia fructicola TaxID=38448 RepID=A0A5M9K2M3_MONFR|nr:hypothetical protein EYC84_004285 [Monilinia fructicola]
MGEVGGFDDVAIAIAIATATATAATANRLRICWATRYTPYRKINRMSQNQQIDPSHPSNDVEKGASSSIPHDPLALSPLNHEPTLSPHLSPLLRQNRFFTFTSQIESFLGLEARGIHRVLPAEQTTKTTLSFLQIVVLWFSINTAPQNITLASIARNSDLRAFYNGMVACEDLCDIECGHLVRIFNDRCRSGRANVICSFTQRKSIRGSGNRRLSCFDIHRHHIRIKIFHHYEGYAWVPQTFVLLILAGTAGSRFDLNSKSTVEGTTLAGNRLSFFSICLSAAITYAPIAADFFVYCDPKIASRWKVFAATLLGLSLSFTFTFVIGAGLASGIPHNPSWEAAGAGSGALIVAGFENLGGFGKFCSVIAALGLIANMVPRHILAALISKS